MGAEQSGVEGGVAVSNQCFHCLGTGTKVHGSTKRRCLRCSGTGLSQAPTQGDMEASPEEQPFSQAEVEHLPHSAVNAAHPQQSHDALSRVAAQRVREAQLSALKMAEGQIAARKQAEAEAATAGNGIDGAGCGGHASGFVGSRSHSRQRSVDEFERLEAEAQRLAIEEGEVTVVDQPQADEGHSPPPAPLPDLLSKRLEDMSPDEIPLFKQKIMESIVNLQRAREKAASRLASAEASAEEDQEDLVEEKVGVQQRAQRVQQVVVPCDVVNNARRHEGAASAMPSSAVPKELIVGDPLGISPAQEQEVCPPSLGELVKEERGSHADSPQPVFPKPIDKAAMLEEAFAAAVRQQANAQDAMRRRVGIKPSLSPVIPKTTSTSASDDVVGKGVGRGKSARSGTSGPAPVP